MVRYFVTRSLGYGVTTDPEERDDGSLLQLL